MGKHKGYDIESYREQGLPAVTFITCGENNCFKTIPRPANGGPRYQPIQRFPTELRGTQNSNRKANTRKAYGPWVVAQFGSRAGTVKREILRYA